jgi:hypothetical protein
MAISVADNFSYQGTKPLDARVSFDTVAAMAAASDATLYDGCFAYVKATQKYYSYDSNNTSDPTTGKWREYELEKYQTKVISSTTDLTPGTSPLATGDIYVVYE